jgi:hypothetical protein
MNTVIDDESLPRAADYPFLAPLERYVFSAIGEAPDFDVAGRTPVLALGSNAAPLQLRRKFGQGFGHIPVSRAVLFDHVVVYSAHFTRYGSLPATLEQHPGGLTFVAITWLDPSQLARMHETEALGINYDYCELADFRLEHDGEALTATSVPIGAYVSRHGPLRHAMAPIRLAETASSGCPWPALTQPAALRFAHRRIAPETAFDTFMERIVADAVFRGDCSERLKAA